jgi:hypothetical protein
MALMAFAFHAIQAFEIAERMLRRTCQTPSSEQEKVSLGKEASGTKLN